MDEWWQNQENFVAHMSTSLEDGLEHIYGRKLESGEWEYAIVRWYYGCPSLECLLRSGKAFDEFGKEMEG